mmetsp:Transcript_87785/g.274981  ORF Transcript_87785/g.274981 Transcript_87785/m.274981 type:complete len:349 (+) Transcript_87785:53-1099(+)
MEPHAAMALAVPRPPRRRNPRLHRRAVATVAAAVLLALQVCLLGSALRGLAWLPAVADVRGAAARDAGLRKGARAEGARRPEAGALPGPVDVTNGGGVLDQGRRAALVGCSASLMVAVFAWGPAVRALVKGNAPPDGYGLGKNLAQKAECKSVVDCQEVGRKREAQTFGQAVKYQMTPSGARFYDMEPGSKEAGVLEKGGTARLKYRVMRQGKRSQDGLSGEASTIFSLGYGEDDGPKDAVLTAPVGQGRFVKALDEGLLGMAVGGKRRVQVRPENGLGWNKEGKCAEEIVAVGVLAGLPSGGAQNEETCLDENKLPQPVDFASKRRFSRRFDESLIVEVELVALGSG